MQAPRDLRASETPQTPLLPSQLCRVTWGRAALLPSPPAMPEDRARPLGAEGSGSSCQELKSALPWWVCRPPRSPVEVGGDVAVLSISFTHLLSSSADSSGEIVFPRLKKPYSLPPFWSLFLTPSFVWGELCSDLCSRRQDDVGSWTHWSSSPSTCLGGTGSSVLIRGLQPCGLLQENWPHVST